MWYIWLIAAGIFFIIEIATVGFLIFWLGIGALLAMCTSFFIEDIFIQTLVFVVSSIILIFLTKPLISKYVDKDKPVSTNAYSVLGKKGIVIIPIDNLSGTGQVKVDGEVWSAKSTGSDIPAGTEVEIQKIDGVKLIVTQMIKEKV